MPLFIEGTILSKLSGTPLWALRAHVDLSATSLLVRPAHSNKTLSLLRVLFPLM